MPRMIVSQRPRIMFFVGWFWAWFDFALFPSQIAEVIGGQFPPKAVEAVMDPFDLAIDDRHRGREQREVEERPEPADEEHDFGGDEQDHAVAEMELDDGGVIARARLGDDLCPPAVESEEQPGETDEEDPAAAIALVGAQVTAMHPHDAADRHRQRGERAHDRHDIGRKDVVIVVLRAGHG